MERKSLSKTTRFEIFKRDSFTCVYCGSHPPESILEIDHIIPISKGGTDDYSNLVTSCFDCNRGKSNKELKTCPEPLIQTIENNKEMEEQIKGYKKLMQSIKRRKDKETTDIEKLFISYFPEWNMSKKFKISSLRPFIDKIGFIEVYESMEIACLRVNDPQYAIKYFCGICWNKIKER